MGHEVTFPSNRTVRHVRCSGSPGLPHEVVVSIFQDPPIDSTDTSWIFLPTVPQGKSVSAYVFHSIHIAAKIVHIYSNITGPMSKGLSTRVGALPAQNKEAEYVAC